MPRTLQNEYILDTDIISDDWMLIDKYPFRTDSRVPVEGREGGGLIQLTLKDFATHDLWRGCPGLDRQIVVKLRQLF